MSKKVCECAKESKTCFSTTDYNLEGIWQLSYAVSCCTRPDLQLLVGHLKSSEWL